MNLIIWWIVNIQVSRGRSFAASWPSPSPPTSLTSGQRLKPSWKKSAELRLYTNRCEIFSIESSCFWSKTLRKGSPHCTKYWCDSGSTFLYETSVSTLPRPGLVLGLRPDLSQKCTLEVHPEVLKLTKCPEQEEEQQKSSNYKLLWRKEYTSFSWEELFLLIKLWNLKSTVCHK